MDDRDNFSGSLKQQLIKPIRLGGSGEDDQKEEGKVTTNTQSRFTTTEVLPKQGAGTKSVPQKSPQHSVPVSGAASVKGQG
jgi:hypothetical protein